MSDQPKKFFAQEREEIKADLVLPSAHDIAALNERKVVALESIADRLSGIEVALTEYLPGRMN